MTFNEQTNPRPDAPLPESRYSIVLVEPQYRDNVGHTARSMLNFDVGDLVLVNTGPIDDTSRQRAVHAQKVLDHARFFPTLPDAAKEFDVLVGFAARVSTLNKAHLRMSEPLETVARRLDDMGGRIGLVFGREDFGLSNEDVEVCDMLCTIPTSPNYRSMNLSHAVTVALYELHRPARPRMPYVSMAKPHEKEILFATWRHLNESLGFKPHRVEQADVMFRRVMGRSGITSWEYHRLMGTYHRMLRRLDAWPPPNVGVGVLKDEGADEGESADGPADDAPGREG